jgi:hypothetical protein
MYSKLLEDEVFKFGESKGRLKTAITILTDMLIELNSLEVYYQKPVSKSVSPDEISALRRKIDVVKSLLQDTLSFEK